VFEFEFEPKLPKAEGLPKLLALVFAFVFVLPKLVELLFPKVVPPKVLLDDVLPKVLFVEPKVEEVLFPKPKLFVGVDDELLLLAGKPKEKAEPPELLLLFDPKVVKAWLFPLELLFPKEKPPEEGVAKDEALKLKDISLPNIACC